jgi:molecular chaperone GrpE
VQQKIPVPLVTREEEPQKTVDERIIEEFEEELAAARREADENRDKYLRAVAEIENVKKRLGRLYEQRLQEGKRQLLLRFLEVADNLERALAMARHEDQAEEGLLEGVDLTYRDLQRMLAQEGVEAMDVVGQPFDPRLHEAVEVVPWQMVAQSFDKIRQVQGGATAGRDDPKEIVVAEIRKGYLYRGQLLRPARVRVTKPTGR